jgi:hypothetical protein
VTYINNGFGRGEKFDDDKHVVVFVNVFEYFTFGVDNQIEVKLNASLLDLISADKHARKQMSTTKVKQETKYIQI